MPNLTDRRHQQTRAEIAQAAIALFRESGFETVTMEDVAAAAGTSRRTVYRHFPSKDDLVFEHPRSWILHFDEVVAENAPDPGISRCLRALRSIANLIDSTAGSVHSAYAVYLQTPSLRGNHGLLDDECFSRFYALADTDLPDDDNKITDAAIIAGALVGTLNGVIAAWVLHWPNRPMVELMEHALKRIRPILPTNKRPSTDPATRRPKPR
jgi:AcrR family transcriptional regulator